MHKKELEMSKFWMATLLLSIGCGVTPSTPDAVTQYEHCWESLDRRDGAAFAACYADPSRSDMVDSVPPLVAEGDGDAIYATRYLPFLTGVPDVIHDHGKTLVSRDGRHIIHVLAAYGTHTGELMGIPPTGRRVGLVSVMHAQLDADGHITDEAQFADLGTFAAQIGISNAPARAVYTAGTLGGWEHVFERGSASEDSNKRTVERFLTAFNSHEVDRVMDLYSERVTFDQMTAPATLQGKQATEEAISGIYAMSSDVSQIATWIMAAGDSVAVVGVRRGTNDGPLGPAIPSTGRSFQLNFLALFRLEDGLITEHTTFESSVALAAQLGLLPGG